MFESEIRWNTIFVSICILDLGSNLTHNVTASSCVTIHTRFLREETDDLRLQDTSKLREMTLLCLFHTKITRK
jgi:hypothetical protein